MAFSHIITPLIPAGTPFILTRGLSASPPTHPENELHCNICITTAIGVDMCIGTTLGSDMSVGTTLGMDMEVRQ
jgi:hypothetical protein